MRQGDIISIAPGWRVSKNVHHVVESIIAPFGEPAEARPPIPTQEERLAEREEKRRRKDERRMSRMLCEMGEEGVAEGGDSAAAEAAKA